MSHLLTLTQFLFKRLLSEKILYILPVVFLGFLISTSFLTYFTESEQIKFVQDMGVSFFSLFSFVFILFTVSVFFEGNENADNDVFLLIKPVSKTQIVIAKYLTMLVTYAIVFVLMASLLIGYLSFQYGHVQTSLMPILYLLFLKYFIFFSVVILFTSLCSRVLATFISVMFYFTANALVFMQSIANELSVSYGKFVSFLSYLLPRFEYFDISEALIFNRPIKVEFLVKVSLYSLTYAAVLFVIILLRENKREY